MERLFIGNFVGVYLKCVNHVKCVKTKFKVTLWNKPDDQREERIFLCSCHIFERVRQK